MAKITKVPASLEAERVAPLGDSARLRLALDAVSGSRTKSEVTHREQSLDRPSALADRQLKAIDLLVAGRPLIEVAKNVAISREQLWRWRQEPAFISRLEQVRAEVHMARADRLWSLIDKSQDVAEESLDEGDPQIAIDVLRLLARGFTDTVPAVTSSAKEPSPAAESGRSLESLECSSCGKVALTERGMKSHRGAKHSGEVT